MKFDIPVFESVEDIINKAPEVLDRFISKKEDKVRSVKGYDLEGGASELFYWRTDLGMISLTIKDGEGAANIRLNQEGAEKLLSWLYANKGE